ncbi:MAG TPA: L-aspartate oxidase [Planctomycetota bacterium]|nr:L-aspartate oxidase [Planctomycetota bacterium]
MASGSPLELRFERYLLPFRSRRLPLYRFDAVVVGCGAAGSAAALAAADGGAEVALLAKGDLEETNTFYAQGGVAAVLGPDDSIEAHVADTLAVGYGLCDEQVVDSVVRAGPGAIADLLRRGAHFDRQRDGSLDLSREGGHSRSRIAHSHGASTGLEIQRTLIRSTRAHQGIALFERTFALDVLTDGDGRAVGMLCQTERGELVVFAADQVVLATGGAGQIYRETTNPAIATGDGVAMAFRAGARLRDLEFFQFHPTCLYIAGAARVLVSEIVRGAGGILRDKSGVRFMPEYHPDAELAPRDVVSLACFDRMVRTRDTNVYLDLSQLGRDPHVLFPGISRICRVFAIDIARDPIPVRPGAHYMIGGVRVDADGRTDLPGLWAVGECASTKLHGANRMGSNSLLEGLVLGRRAGALVAHERRGDATRLPDSGGEPAGNADHGLRLSLEDMTYSLKSLMWRQMGIERSGPALADAAERLDFWRHAIDSLAPAEPRAWELENMLTLSRLATAAALAREESRGTHHRRDFPEPRDSWRVHLALRPELSGGRVVATHLEREPVAAPAPTHR